MDFKGITWAGNIYQKFEEMCLEVEEVMFEDTAKYVESQVEIVGVSVKKFYSEIIQDLLPSDPQADMGKKTKLDKRDIKRGLDKKKTRDEKYSDPTADIKSPLNACNDANSFSPVSPRVPVEDACTAESKKVSKQKNSPELSRGMTFSPPSRDESNLLVFDMKSSHLLASADKNVTKPSRFPVTNDRGEAALQHTPISDATVESFTTDQNLSAERKEKNDTQYTSLKQRKDDLECNSSCHGLPTEPFETLRIGCSLSQIKLNAGSSTREVELEGDEVIVSYEDDDAEAAEKSKLEESCILVELDKPLCVSPETKTHKSYKKKILEALSSKLRSTGKQDQHDFHRTGLSSDDEHHPCESDWELL